MHAKCRRIKKDLAVSIAASFSDAVPWLSRVQLPRSSASGLGAVKEIDEAVWLQQQSV
jgi:hypothetical protein